MDGLPAPAAPAFGYRASGSGRKAQYLYLTANKIPERDKQNNAGRLDVDDFRVAVVWYAHTIAGSLSLHYRCAP